MQNKARFGLLGMLAGVVFTAIGCGGPSYKARTVEVYLSDALRQGSVPTIEVDLIAADEDSGLSDLRSMPVDSYFAPGNASRANKTKHTMKFSNADPEPKTFMKNDAGWQDWASYTHLVVLASLRGDFDNGGGDPRRWVIPLSSERWNTGDVIKIEVQSTGLKLRSTMKPVKD